MAGPAYRVLLVDSDPSEGAPIAERLGREGFDVESIRDPHDVVPDATPDLLVIDSLLLDHGGRSLLDTLQGRSPGMITILLDGPGNLPEAGRSERFADRLPKPVDMDLLLRTVHGLTGTTNGAGAPIDDGLSHLIGQSPAMLHVLRITRKVAQSDASGICIRGESGTGKDLLARAIHTESPRADRPFVSVMCTAFQDTLLENDLFGHDKGAFTDAKTQKKGLFELADGGTIFLNEIGDMSPSLQAKLLRVLDEQTFRRVGGAEDIRVDVRVLAATNRNLEALIKEGRFRIDLFYRLNILPLHLPPLRERREDISLFVSLFLKRNSLKYGRPFTAIEPAALGMLERHDWPGNIRELRNVLERACVLAAGPELREKDLGFWFPESSPESQGALSLPPGGVHLDQVEKDLVVQALRRSRGNQTAAAALLGISRFRLRSRIKRHGLHEEKANEHRER